MKRQLGPARWLLAATFVLVSQVASAACTVSAQSLIFGSYDVFSNQPLDSVGNVAVSCDVATPYTVALSPGLNGTYALRALGNGSLRLDYNLFLDVGRGVIWGDGTGGSDLARGNSASANHAVYGRIPAGQNATIGAYSDTVTVTILY